MQLWNQARWYRSGRLRIAAMKSKERRKYWSCDIQWSIHHCYKQYHEDRDVGNSHVSISLDLNTAIPCFLSDICWRTSRRATSISVTRSMHTKNHLFVVIGIHQGRGFSFNFSRPDCDEVLCRFVAIGWIEKSPSGPITLWKYRFSRFPIEALRSSPAFCKWSLKAWLAARISATDEIDTLSQSFKWSGVVCIRFGYQEYESVSPLKMSVICYHRWWDKW